MTTAPEGPRSGGPRDPSADETRRGKRAATIIFAACAALHVTAVMWAKLSGSPGGPLYVLFLDVLMTLVAAAVALVVHHHLPAPARRPFWLMGNLWMALSLLLWGTTCGLVLG